MSLANVKYHVQEWLILSLLKVFSPPSEHQFDKIYKRVQIIRYEIFSLLQRHGLLKTNWSEHFVEK